MLLEEDSWAPSGPTTASFRNSSSNQLESWIEPVAYNLSQPAIPTESPVQHLELKFAEEKITNDSQDFYGS